MILTPESQAKLKELRESHNWCCIEISSDYCYVWYISLTRGYSPGRKEGKHEPCVHSGAHDDLNDAVDEVCKLAEEYLENEKKSSSTISK